MVILDGKALAEKIIAGLKDEYGRLTKQPVLAAIVVGENPVIAKFVAQKKKVAEELGVDFRTYDYSPDISTNELRKRIATIVHDADPDGIIIQLPLPPHINQQYILNGVPAEKDADVLSARAVGDFSVGTPPHQYIGGGGGSKILPPVVGAIKALFEEYGIDYKAKHAVVVGAGTLVGKPVAAWLANEKVSFTVIDENTPDVSAFTKTADIVISGVGKPGLITGDMIKEGAVVVDAGTSESAGKLMGDADYNSVAAKTSHITPVPGGVGPLTIAMIFKNLLTLATMV